MRVHLQPGGLKPDEAGGMHGIECSLQAGSVRWALGTKSTPIHQRQRVDWIATMYDSRLRPLSHDPQGMHLNA